MHLDIQVGEHANNYPEIAAKDKLTELQLRARQLLDQVEQIQKEQNYQRVRHFCWTSISLVGNNGGSSIRHWKCPSVNGILLRISLILQVPGLWVVSCNHHHHLKSLHQFEAERECVLDVAVKNEFGRCWCGMGKHG